MESSRLDAQAHVHLGCVRSPRHTLLSRHLTFGHCRPTVQAAIPSVRFDSGAQIGGLARILRGSSPYAGVLTAATPAPWPDAYRTVRYYDAHLLHVFGTPYLANVSRP